MYVGNNEDRPFVAAMILVRNSKKVGAGGTAAQAR